MGESSRDLRRLQESEERHRLIVEATPAAQVMVDAAGRIVLVNRQTEKLFGYGREELVGKSVETLIPERFRRSHPVALGQFFRSPQTRAMGAGRDLYGLTKDGVEIPVEIGLNPMETREGLYVLAVIIDITERKRAEERARDLDRKSLELEEENRRIAEANRMKSEFLANMSHELRTPLNAVIGFSELLHDGKAGPLTAEQKEFLGDILTSSRHLLGLINDVLDLAKLESGKMAFRPEDLSLAQVIGEVRGVLAALAEKKKVDLKVAVDPGVDKVTLDAGRLKQVLYNYVSNALKFTAEGGRVQVRARADGDDFFRLEVEDSGIGIHRRDFHRLFVEFQQLDHSLTKKQGGTGLGLALTKKIVEAQGGRVGVDSVFGRGSTFHAVLPRDARKAVSRA